MRKPVHDLASGRKDIMFQPEAVGSADAVK